MQEDGEYFDPEETIDGENLNSSDLEDGPDFEDDEEDQEGDDQEEDDEDGDEEDGDEDGEENWENDITSYRTTREIFESGRFTAEERRVEYRRRGKSPSGVIDGEYNDTFLDDGEAYNDSNRDWDADA